MMIKAVLGPTKRHKNGSAPPPTRIITNTLCYNVARRFTWMAVSWHGSGWVVLIIHVVDTNCSLYAFKFAIYCTTSQFNGVPHRLSTWADTRFNGLFLYCCSVGADPLLLLHNPPTFIQLSLLIPPTESDSQSNSRGCRVLSRKKM